MKPAVFLDRDGTIIEDVGHIGSVRDVQWYPETFISLQKLTGYFDLFIVTHQPGVARGLVSLQDVIEVNTYVTEVLLKNRIPIREVYVCPHDRSDGCSCIKPLPYFLHIAADRYDIDLESSYVIGDHPHDVELALNAGAKGIYVLSGHGEKHRDQIPEHTIVVNKIGEAIQHILKNTK